MMGAMYTVRPALQPYAWGTRDDIPALLGIDPTGGPVAEAWWGTHVDGPAICVVDGVEAPLSEVVAADAAAALGPDTAAAFGGALPYLLKVLAVGGPLSLQVHPSAAMAADGFAREEAAGVPLGHPDRIYRDRSHKPEMVVALTPMVVLAGFRRAADVRRDVAALDHPEAAELARLLDDPDESAAIAAFMGRCLRGIDATGLNAALARLAAEPDANANVRAASEAASRFPTDGGVLVALAMNRVDLAPGDACFTPDRMVHSYQSGVGVEIMANSDNVIRAGLTPKHIDIDELLAVASTEPQEPPRPRVATDGAVTTFRPAAEEFALAVVRGGAMEAPPAPRVVLVLEGACEVRVDGETRELGAGDAVFVPYADGRLAIDADGVAAVAFPGAPGA